MSKTFNDIMLECENFEYSRERFENLKEAAEISLSDQYIRNQLFLIECGEVIQESGMDTEYFSESTQVESLQVLVEKTLTRSTSLKSKIFRAMIKILQAFRNFVGRIKMQFDKTVQDSRKLVNAIKDKIFDDDEVDDLKELIDDCRDKCPGFNPRDIQPFRQKIHLKTENRNQERDMMIKDALAAALSDNKVIASVALWNQDGTVGAIPIETLQKAGATAKTQKLEDFTAACEILTKGWAEAKKTGIEIKVIPTELDRAESEIGEVVDIFTAICNNTEDALGFSADVATTLHDKNNQNNPNKATPASKRLGIQGKALGFIADELSANTSRISDVINKLHGYVDSSVGASMRLYSDYAKYRKLMIAGLKPMLLKETKNPKDDKK